MADKTNLCARCEQPLEEGSTGRMCAFCQSAVKELSRLYFAHFERIAAAEEAEKAAARAKERP